MIRPIAIALAGASSLLYSNIALAQEEGESLDGGFASPLSDATIYFEADAAAFFETPAIGNDDFSADGVVGVDITGPVGKTLEVSVIPEFRWSAGTDIVGNQVEFVENDLDRPLFTLAEAWISSRAGPFDLKVGKQIQSWGTGDLYSPSDDLNAIDQLDVPDAYKIGEPMIVLGYSTPGFAVEAVAIPWFTPDRLPQLDNPWSLGAEAAADFVEGITGIRPEVALGNHELPDGFDPLQFGARVTSSSLFAGTDVFISAFRGVSRTPVFQPRLETARLLTLDAEYPSYFEAATGFSTVAGSFELHGEVAWHITDKSDRDDDYLAFVVGFRRDFSVVDRTSLTNVRLTMEYAGEIVTRDKDEDSLYVSSPFNRPTDNAVLVTIDFEFGEDTKLMLGGIVNLDDIDHAFDAGVEHRFNDHLTFSAGARFFGGEKNSFFGEWRKNDHAYAALKFNL